jgi:GTP 3',8-cyclase
MLTDTFKRKIDYLRLSVTDRCNFRCVYCLPEKTEDYIPSPDILSDEEILHLLSCFVELGFSKVRITGGEPLVRIGVADLIRRISKLNGIKDVAVSTNGFLLNPMARDLYRAGLKRVNVSMDSMDPVKFNQITRYGNLEKVLSGIDAALSSGLSPVKINVVVARGMNEDEISDFVKLTEKNPLHVRFIELMPMGETGFFSKEKWVPIHEILEKAQPLEKLESEDWPLGHGPARYFKRPGSQGTVGIISALSHGFCSTCNRVRLSAQGVLVPCLDDSKGVGLRDLLRQGAGRDVLKKLIYETVERKPEQHHMLERASTESSHPRFMCQIGG